MPTDAEVEKLVKEFGTMHRKLIVNALTRLEEQEPKWGQKKPLNRRTFIRDLTQRVAK